MKWVFGEIFSLFSTNDRKRSTALSGLNHPPTMSFFQVLNCSYKYLCQEWYCSLHLKVVRISKNSIKRLILNSCGGVLKGNNDRAADSVSIRREDSKNTDGNDDYWTAETSNNWLKNNHQLLILVKCWCSFSSVRMCCFYFFNKTANFIFSLQLTTLYSN